MLNSDVAPLGAFRVSDDGSHSIAQLDINPITGTVSGAPGYTNMVLLNLTPAVLSDGSTVVVEDQVLPVAFGGDGVVAEFEGFSGREVNQRG